MSPLPAQAWGHAPSGLPGSNPAQLQMDKQPLSAWFDATLAALAVLIWCESAHMKQTGTLKINNQAGSSHLQLLDLRQKVVAVQCRSGRLHLPLRCVKGWMRGTMERG